MKRKSIIEMAVKVIVAALTAFLTALGTTSCIGLMHPTQDDSSMTAYSRSAVIQLDRNGEAPSPHSTTWFLKPKWRKQAE